MKAGWNLVAFPNTTPLQGHDFVARTCPTTIVPLGQVLLPQFNEIQPDRTYQQVDVSTGKPYWVFASQSGRSAMARRHPPAEQAPEHTFGGLFIFLRENCNNSSTWPVRVVSGLCPSADLLSGCKQVPRRRDKWLSASSA